MANWSTTLILHGIANITDRRVAATYALLDGRQASRIERKAKQKAPWTDRTANARQGLHAKGFMNSRTMGVRLSHSVKYGIGLEYKNQGRYAIIRPTIEKESPAVFNAVRRIWGD